MSDSLPWLCVGTWPRALGYADDAAGRYSSSGNERGRRSRVVGLDDGVMFHALAADDLDAAFCLLAGDTADGLAVEYLSQDEAIAAFAPGRGPVRPTSPSKTSPDTRSSRGGSAITCVVRPDVRRRRADRSTSPSRAAIRSSCGRSPLAASPPPSLGRSTPPGRMPSTVRTCPTETGAPITRSPRSPTMRTVSWSPRTRFPSRPPVAGITAPAAPRHDRQRGQRCAPLALR